MFLNKILCELRKYWQSTGSYGNGVISKKRLHSIHPGKQIGKTVISEKNKVFSLIHLRS